MKIKIATFLMAAFLCGCKNGENISLQRYCLEKESDPNFLVVNLPSSLISLVSGNDMPKELKDDVLPRLKKLHIFVFKPSSTMTDEEIAKEQRMVKKILKNIDYQELMKVKGKFGLLHFLYKGDLEKRLVDEILVYSKLHRKKTGVGFVLVRAIADEFPLDKMSMVTDYLQGIDASTHKDLGI